jgi:putative cell wall-binding protein
MTSRTEGRAGGARFMRALISALAGMAIVVPSLTLAPAQPASAADASRFDPGYLISDYAFFNGAAMSEAEIQAFLESKSGVCTNANCLDVLQLDTQDKSVTVRCNGYVGQPAERASRILYKIQTSCNISAKALLVTLEKEQSLVTSTGPSSGRLERAMGYYCPDDPTRPGYCDPAYAGFFNQVYNAAAQFQRYRQNGGGNYPVGQRTIFFHPTSNPAYYNPPKCGSKVVNIRNLATSGLYTYTPYTPNDAAMANLYGTGDSCSSYGNRNFWRLYTDWFGSPTTLVPAGVKTTSIAGVDRYVTAATISAQAYPSGASTVYLAAGTAFPDGLSAAPVAAAQGAPLLLTAKDHVPAPTLDEIRRLSPTRIVILGGPLVLDPTIEANLAGLAPTIERVAGIDRYETARLLARSVFPAATTTTAYIATGDNFPDALAASAAAGAQRAPVLLVKPTDTAVSPELVEILRYFGVTRIVIMGATPVIGAALESSLRSVTGVTRVDRFGGQTRYDTALALNRSEFPRATRAYIASGTSFADAMSAAAVAGAVKAPIVLSNGTCVIPGALQHLVDAGVTEVSVLGGPLVMRSTVREYLSCG